MTASQHNIRLARLCDQRREIRAGIRAIDAEIRKILRAAIRRKYAASRAAFVSATRHKLQLWEESK